MGPAGVGMALLEGRAAAAAARTEKILEDARSAREAAEGGLGWVPARDTSLGRRPSCAVPPLLELCVRLIRDHIEDVESLWGLPDAIKVWRMQSGVITPRHMSVSCPDARNCSSLQLWCSCPCCAK